MQAPALQVSAVVHGSPSLQEFPVNGTTVHDALPLQDRVLHVSLTQLIGAPTHVPALQGFPVIGASVHGVVPLRDRVLLTSLGQLIGAPTHVPALQVSV